MENTRQISNLAEVVFPSWGGNEKLMQPKFNVPVLRFPLWHFCPNCNIMQKLSHDTRLQSDVSTGFQTPTCKNPDCKGKQLNPMRFVNVCSNGHMEELNWNRFAPHKLCRTK